MKEQTWIDPRVDRSDWGPGPFRSQQSIGTMTEKVLVGLLVAAIWVVAMSAGLWSVSHFSLRPELAFWAGVGAVLLYRLLEIVIFEPRKRLTV